MACIVKLDFEVELLLCGMAPLQSQNGMFAIRTESTSELPRVGFQNAFVTFHSLTKETGMLETVG